MENGETFAFENKTRSSRSASLAVLHSDGQAHSTTPVPIPGSFMQEHSRNNHTVDPLRTAPSFLGTNYLDMVWNVLAVVRVI